MSIKTCPRCQNRKLYRVRRGKLRCKNRLYEFKPKLEGLRLSREKWILELHSPSPKLFYFPQRQYPQTKVLL